MDYTRHAETLGVRIELTPEQVAKCVEQCGIGFMYAPVNHPAMKMPYGNTGRRRVRRPHLRPQHPSGRKYLRDVRDVCPGGGDGGGLPQRCPWTLCDLRICIFFLFLVIILKCRNEQLVLVIIV